MVIAINKFATDTDAELQAIKSASKEAGQAACDSCQGRAPATHWCHCVAAGDLSSSSQRAPMCLPAAFISQKLAALMPAD